MKNRRRTKRPWRYTWVAKRIVAYVILFFVILGFAALPLAKGSLFAETYWGGALFVPVILAVAALCIAIAVRDIRAQWRKRYSK